MIGTSDTYLCGTPKTLYSDEDYSVKPPPHGTVEKLIQTLKEYGPLVAEAKVGPGAYNGAPCKLPDQVEGHAIYGWKAGTAKANAAAIPVILVGAKKDEDKAYVFYVLAKDVTGDKMSLVRKHVPSSTDAKVYVSSYANFYERRLVNLHPIVPHGTWLYETVKVDDILGKDKEECQRVGQQIFDHYKRLGRDDSEAGKEAVKRVCNAAIHFCEPDRHRNIEKAWNRIGDANWTWMG